MVARYAIEHWTRLPTEIEVASEFRYRDPVLDAQSLVVGVSQSGESLDTMEACRFARSATNKAKVLVVCNVVDSSMAREADAVLYTRAGPEIGVAATKTHVAQIVAMELLALRLAQVRGLLYPEEVARQVEALNAIPGLIEGVLARSDEICDIAARYKDTRDFFFLGRGVGYPVALEGALKLKEISYARAEAYPAGEMKHGPIALIEPGTVVVAVATRGRLHAKIMSNIDEVRARGATVVVVANEGDEAAAAHADDVLWVPAVPRGGELFSPGRRRGGAPALRLRRGQGPGLRRRPAPQPGQDGHGRITRDRDRNRHGGGRTVPQGAGEAAGDRRPAVHAGRAGLRPAPAGPVGAAGRPVRGQGGGDEGARRGPRRLRLP